MPALNSYFEPIVIFFKSAPIGFKWPSYSPGAGEVSAGKRNSFGGFIIAVWDLVLVISSALVGS